MPGRRVLRRPRALTGVAGRRRRLRWTIRALQGALALTAAVGVWLVGFAPEADEPAVLPDTAAQFSLDLEVLATAEGPVVYAVEQRARPDYRIFRLDPTTGEIDTVFTVPEDAIVYGIDVDPTGSTLAVAYSPDFALESSGLWTLDIDDGTLTEVSPGVSGIYLTDPDWHDDGTAILATRVDQREGEQLDVVRADVTTGTIDLVAADGVNPVVDGDLVHYLGVDTGTSARRSIRTLDRTTGGVTIVAGGDGDLDHLLGDSTELVLAVLDDGETTTGLTLGTPASAHGNHDVPSTWWSVRGSASAPSGLAPATVYDADLVDGALVSVTLEGLVVDADSQTQVIASRALRFVAVAPA